MQVSILTAIFLTTSSGVSALRDAALALSLSSTSGGEAGASCDPANVFAYPYDASNCANGFLCNTTSATCVARPAGDIGTSCSKDSECSKDLTCYGNYMCWPVQNDVGGNCGSGGNFPVAVCKPELQCNFNVEENKIQSTGVWGATSGSQTSQAVQPSSAPTQGNGNEQQNGQQPTGSTAAPVDKPIVGTTTSKSSSLGRAVFTSVTFAWACSML